MGISIIVITKNEEKNIIDCLKSISKILDINKNIILVDSCSTDKTIEYVKKFSNVKIIKLKNSKLLSPSVGRFIGTKYATEDFILFIDGDQIIDHSWVSYAYNELKKGKSDVIFGEYYHSNKKKPIIKENNSFPINTLVGTFMIKKTVLLESGGFNPNIRGEEELDLALRILKKGFVISKTSKIMAYHNVKQQDLSEIIKRSKYLQGLGQLLKNNLLSKYFLLIIIKRLKYFAITFYQFIIVFFFILSFFNKFYIFLCLIMLIFYFFIFLLFSPRFETISQIIKSFIIPISIFKGFFIKNVPRNMYLSLVTNKF